MKTAFESIKTGLLQAIAHQQNDPVEVVVHVPESPARSSESTSPDTKSEASPK